MSNVSTRFLVCFASLTLVGAAVAQTPDPLAGAMSNSVSSSASALGAQPTSAVRLNAPRTDLSGIANALGEASTTSRMAALKEAGVTGGENVAKIKLGAGSGSPSTPDTSLFGKAVSSASLSNAIGEAGINPGASGVSGANEMKAATVVGVGSGNFSNALGEQRPISNQRLGGK